jgi:hypothetical protein
MARFETNDAKFDEQQQLRYDYFNAPENSPRLISANDLSLLSTLMSDWNLYYPKSVDPNSSTATIPKLKTTTRKSLEKWLVRVFNDIPYTTLTAADRGGL